MLNIGELMSKALLPGREADYPNNAFNTWVEYKLDQKCDSSNSADGLYTPKDIISEINDKLGTKHTVQRLSGWRALKDRSIPDAVIINVVNPEMVNVMKWYFTSKGCFDASIDLDALGVAFSVPAKNPDF
jgi:hypothetical protein